MKKVKQSWKDFHANVSDPKIKDSLSSICAVCFCSNQLPAAFKRLGWINVKKRGEWTYTGPAHMRGNDWEKVRKALKAAYGGFDYVPTNTTLPGTPELPLPTNQLITTREYIQEMPDALLAAEFERRGWYGVIQKEETLQGINYRQSMAIGKKKD
jgi:hypothetical protein